MTDRGTMVSELSAGAASLGSLDISASGTGSEQARTAKSSPVRWGRASTLEEAYLVFNNRAPGFDTLRVIAATAVVVHHAFLAFHPLKSDLIYQWSHGATQLGFLSVSIFFALSGFLVVPGLLKSGDVVDYLIRRVVRIVPLLAVVVFATAFIVGPIITTMGLSEYYTDARAFLYLKNITTSLSLDLPGVVTYHGTSQVNGALWTLRFEWICYFVLAAASLTGVLRRRALFTAFYVACVCAAFAMDHFMIAGLSGTALNTSLRLFAYFGGGVMVYLYRSVLPMSWAYVIAALVGAALAYRFEVGELIAPILLAYVIAGIGLVTWPWTVFLGKADVSYGIYLIHSVVLVVVMHFLQLGDPFRLLAVALPITVALALCSWFLIERPALRTKGMVSQAVAQVGRKLGFA